MARPSSADFEEKKVTLSRFDGLTVAVGSTQRYTSIEMRNQFSSVARNINLCVLQEEREREKERGRSAAFTLVSSLLARHYLRPSHSHLLFAEHGNLKRSSHVDVERVGRAIPLQLPLDRSAVYNLSYDTS